MAPFSTSPTIIPNFLNSSYSTFIIVSEFSHLEPEDGFNDNTLIVTSDWLLWRQCIDKSRHAIHIESLLGTWPADRGVADNFYIEAYEWMFDGDVDMTMFSGVSLGSQFNGHVPLFKHAWLRMDRGLKLLISTYTPKNIIYRGLRCEYDFINPSMMLGIAKAASVDFGASFVADVKPVNWNCFTYPVSRYSRRNNPRWTLKSILRRPLLWAINIVFEIRHRMIQRPAVLVVHNQLASEAVVSKFNPQYVAPMLIANITSKRISFLRMCWKRGIILASPKQRRLNQLEITRLNEIITWIKMRAAVETDPCNRDVLRFIESEILQSGWIHERAREVVSYRALLKRTGCARIVVGHAENMFCQLLIEAGAALNIQSDENLNGGFMHRQATDVRNVFKGKKPKLDRLLSWGEQNEKWLKYTGAAIKSARTGYPRVAVLSDKYIKPSENKGRALILPQMVDGHDIEALFANSYAALIDTIEELRRAGYHELRIKPHPGFPETASYFRDILDYFKIKATVIINSPLRDQVEWSDIVVGPINTNSLIEVIALGRPYYPIWTTPSSLEPKLFGGLTASMTREDLRTALIDPPAVETCKILEEYVSFSSITNPMHRFWSVIDDTVK